ncbi:polyprotein [Basavirus sp.]|nr:polyprotein [Basavirus sp.]
MNTFKPIKPVYDSSYFHQLAIMNEKENGCVETKTNEQVEMEKEAIRATRDGAYEHIAPLDKKDNGKSLRTMNYIRRHINHNLVKKYTMMRKFNTRQMLKDYDYKLVLAKDLDYYNPDHVTYKCGTNCVDKTYHDHLHLVMPNLYATLTPQRKTFMIDPHEFDYDIDQFLRFVRIIFPKVDEFYKSTFKCIPDDEVRRSFWKYFEMSVLQMSNYMKITIPDEYHKNTAYWKVYNNNEEAYQQLEDDKYYTFGQTPSNLVKWYRDAILEMMFGIVIAIDVEPSRVLKKKIKAMRLMMAVLYRNDYTLRVASELSIPPVFLRYLYKIRQFVGINTDFGLKDEFIAQGKAKESDNEEEAVMFHEIADEVSGPEKTSGIFERLWNKLFGFVSACGTKGFDKVKEYAKKILTWMIPECVKNLATSAWSCLKRICLGLLALVLCYVLGPMARIFLRIVETIFKIRSMTGSSAVEVAPNITVNVMERPPKEEKTMLGKVTDFVSQGALPGICLSSVLIAVFSWNEKTRSKIRQWCELITKMVAGGTILLASVAFLLNFLPPCIASSLRYQFGSKEEQEMVDVQNWKMEAECLITLSTTDSQFYRNEKYAKDARETLKNGRDIIMKIVNPGTRTLVIGVWVKLYKIVNTITRIENTTATRPPPFVIHLYGNAGVGKTTTTNTIREMLGFGSQDYYPVVPLTEYWNGYNGHTFIFMDEFLVGGDNVDKNRSLSNFIGAANTGTWMPPLADLTNPIVGIKGTQAAPKVIVTASHDPNYFCLGQNDSAMDRRRDLVIELTMKDDAPCNNGILNFASLTDEDVATKSWLECRFVNPLRSASSEATTKVAGMDVNTHKKRTWTETAELIKKAYSAHANQIEKSVKRGDYEPYKENLYEEMKLSILSANHGIPQKRMTPGEMFTYILDSTALTGLWNKVTSTVSSLTGYTAQGKKKKFRPIQQHIEAEQTETEQQPQIEEPKTTTTTTTTTPPTSDGDFASVNGEPMDIVEKWIAKMSYPIEVFNTWQKAKDDYAKKFETVMNFDTYAYMFTIAVMSANKTLLPIPTRTEVIFLPADFDMHNENDYAVARHLGVLCKQELGPLETLTPKWSFAAILTAFIAVFLAITGIAYMVRRMFGKGRDAEMELVSYVAENNPSNERARGRVSTQKAHRVTRGLRGQAPEISPVDIVLNGEAIKAIPIKERIYLTYYHWTITSNLDIENDNMIKYRIEGPNGTLNGSLNADEDIVNIGGDRLLVRIPHKSLPNNRDITSHLIRREDLDKIGNTAIQIVLNTGRTYKNGPAKRSLNNMGEPRNIAYAIKDADERIELEEYVEYDISTEHGDCGSPIIAAKGPKFAHKLLGMHVAGSRQKARGVATPIYQELIQQGLEEFDDGTIEAQGNVSVCDETPVFPVFMPEKTMIIPSPIHGMLKVPSTKEPAILTMRDPRANGVDPIQLSIHTLDSVAEVEVDKNILANISEQLYVDLSNTLTWPVGKRQLTTEEAIIGIPSFLNSIPTNSSPGYPLFTTRRLTGKRDHVRIEANGTYEVSETLYEQIELMESNMRTYNGDFESINHRFYGYMKDELRTRSKIEACETRMIFCNDMVANIVFRKKCGALISAIQSSWKDTPFAIGLNPESWNCDDIYCYLKEVGDRFYSGDFKQFDMRHVQEIRLEAYGILRKLLGKLVTDNEWNYIVDHETRSLCQVGSTIFRTRSNHFSGCFWTTILNCLVVVLYFMYVFKRLLPEKTFLDICRIKVLGDDNIIAVSPDLDITPKQIQKAFEELGQKFTHSEKTVEVTDQWMTYEETSFLGTHPVIVGNRYCGALRWQSLWETPQWLQSANVDLHVLCYQMLERAAVWPREQFEEYQENLVGAFEYAGLSPLSRVPWEETRLNVARRFVESIGDLVAQGGGEGLTTLPVETGLDTDRGELSGDRANLAGLAVNDSAKEISFGMDSIVYRETVVWTTGNTAEQVIWKSQVPFGLLTTGETENVQNMPFTRFIYTVPSMEVLFQINATQFQQGLIVAFFAPLAHPTDTVNLPNKATIYNYTHVRIQPNESATHVINIPMQYFRNVLNTFSGGIGEDSLGYVGLSVVVPLVTALETETSITVSTRFNSTKFTIPRPVPNTYILKDRLRFSEKYRKDILALVKPKEGKTTECEFVAQGAAQSTSNTNVTYNIENVAGSVPVENNIGTTQSTSAEGQLDLEIPLDNPPLASGTVPMFQLLPSNSKNATLDPVMAMQHHPTMMHREPIAISDHSETSIQTLCGKQNIRSIHQWSVTQDPGTQLVQFPLNSLLMDRNEIYNSNSGLGPELGVSLATLNMFKFFRCDFEFTFEVIKTPFHSGRLSVSMGYGTPELEPPERNVYYNKILNYSKENSVEKWLVQYNVGTEYIRTWDGSYIHENQDYNLGRLMVCVHNRLLAPADTVSQSVSLIVSFRLLNVCVYEMNPVPFLSNTEGYELTNTTPVNPTQRARTKPDYNSTTSTPMSTTTTTAKPTYKKNLLNELTLLLPNKALKASQGSSRKPIPGHPYLSEINGFMYKWNGTHYTVPTEEDYLIAQGGEPIANEETEIVSDTKATPATAEETPVPRPMPCRLQLGRKFEYNVKFIEEIYRRYTPMRINNFWTSVAPSYVNPDSDAGNMNYKFSGRIPVHLDSVFTYYFKMWSGHINYHIRMHNHGVVYSRLVNVPNDYEASQNVMFGPPPGIFSRQWYSYLTPNQSSSQAIRVRSTDLLEVSFVPTEMATPIGGNESFLSLSIPFNSHYLGLPTPDSRTGNAKEQYKLNSYHSFLEIIASRSVQDSEIFFFRSAGDDFKLQIFCPRRFYYRPVAGTYNANARAYIDGNVFPYNPLS